MWWIDALTVVVSCAALGTWGAVIWIVFSDTRQAVEARAKAEAKAEAQATTPTLIKPN